MVAQLNLRMQTIILSFNTLKQIFKRFSTDKSNLTICQAAGF